MTHRSDVTRGRQVIERWCILAEQRLDHLTELFESGRWRRFHSEVAFLENIREAKAAVETWRTLLNREGSPDNLAVDTSWLGRRKALPPRPASILREDIHPTLPRSLQIVAERTAPEPPTDVPLVVNLRVAAAPPARVELAPATEDAWKSGLDLAVMQQRYPLLRNAL